MPELPEVEATRRRIARAMVRARIAAVDLRRADLRDPFPDRFVERLVLEHALARRSARAADRDARFLVYDRPGEPCATKNCPGTIRRSVRGGRSTFHCPVCQR